MGFGKREGPPPPRWSQEPKPVSGETASKIEELDLELLRTSEDKYASVKDAIDKAIADMDTSTAEIAVTDVQNAINAATNSRQGSLLQRETVRKYLETKREKGRGR